MGIWLLCKNWQLMGRIAAANNIAPLMYRQDLWEAEWLATFLLEGEAMFAQLHLIPSEQVEASSPQFTFVQRSGWPLDDLTLGVPFLQCGTSSQKLVGHVMQKALSTACLRRRARPRSPTSSAICSFASARRISLNSIPYFEIPRSSSYSSSASCSITTFSHTVHRRWSKVPVHPICFFVSYRR